MRRLLGRLVAVVLVCGGAVSSVAAEEPDGARRALPEPVAETPAQDAPAASREPAKAAPEHDPNRALEPREFRGAIHSLNQIRDGAVAVTGAVTFVLSALMLGALLLFTGGVAPQATARASVAVRDHPLRSFAIGAASILLGVLLGAATRGVAAVILLPFFTAAICIGLAGVCEQLGRNVVHLAGREGNRVGHLLSGCALFSLVSVIPLLGWFGLFPYYLAVGIGASFSTMLGGRRAEPAPTAYRGL